VPYSGQQHGAMLAGVEHSPARQVLLVVDDSACTRRAVIVTAALAADWQAEVVVCRVRTKRPSRGGAIASEPLDAALGIVAGAGDALIHLGATVGDRLVVTALASAAEGVVHTAYERAASMIVVPHPARRTRGATAARRLARQVANRSDIPVLLVGPGLGGADSLVQRRARAARPRVDDRA